MTAIPGEPSRAILANLTDANPYAVPGNYVVTITWGDGNTSSGVVVSGGQGGFVVEYTGTHAYARGGSYSYQVSIQENGGTTTTAQGTATVLAEFPIGATAGATFHGTVARLLDPGAGATTTVTWGDGTTSSGTLAADPANAGQVLVSATHVYLQSGTYAMLVQVVAASGQTTLVPTSAIVANAALTITTTGLTVIPGDASTGTLASFIDSNPNGVLANYTATVSWGDGNTSSAVVANGSQGGFVVQYTGTHAYAHSGSYPYQVSIVEQGGTTTTAQGTAMALAEPQILATQGNSFQGTVARLLNPGAGATATVTWGDGSQSSGSISPDSSHPGQVLVTATHTYAKAGNYAASTLVTAASGQTTLIANTAAVADVPLTARAANFTANAGSAFSGVLVARFFTANGSGIVGDFTATVTWGDGSASQGTVASDGHGGYVVDGAHTYAYGGEYVYKVQVTDQGGSTATTQGTATVGALPLTAFPGVSISPLIDTFTNPGSSILAHLSATIDWGDHTSVSVISFGSSSSATASVSAPHTYASTGDYLVHVTVSGASYTTTTFAVQAIVNPPLIQVTKAMVPYTTYVGIPITNINLGSFSDNSSETVTATIDWGDGTTPTAGTILSTGKRPHGSR